MPRKDYYQRFDSLNLTDRQDFAAFFKLNKIKLSETSVANHFLGLAEKLRQFAFSYPADSYPELVYAYVYELRQPPVCQHCGGARVAFKQYSHGYFSYCSVKCSSNSEAKKKGIVQTNRVRYGVANPSAAQAVKAKRRATFLERYGSVGVLGNARVAALARQTCELRYGSPHFFSSEAGKQAATEGMNKIYGVRNPMQRSDIVQRSLQTREQKGLICKWAPDEEHSLAVYRLAVKMHSERNYRKHFYEINPEKKSRSKHEYHLDHIFPVIEGWLQGVAPELVAHPKNLQLLWCTDNIVKGARMDCSVAEFYRLLDENLIQAGVMSESNDNVFSLDEDF